MITELLSKLEYVDTIRNIHTSRILMRKDKKDATKTCVER